MEDALGSVELPVEGVSYVAPEYRISHVLATHPSTKGSDRNASDVAAVQESLQATEVDISVVPPEDRTSVVRRI